MKKHETDLVREKPETLLEILRSLDGYTQLTGSSVKAFRGGLTNKLEKSVFENTNNKSVFLDALMERLERLNRAGAFLQSTTPPKKENEPLRISQSYSLHALVLLKPARLKCKWHKLS